MTDLRTVDLEGAPDGSEIRLQRGRGGGEIVVSLWLPADALEMAETLMALSKAGFEFVRTSGSQSSSPALLRRFLEFTADELHMLAAGLSKDRMHGAWMNKWQLERSVDLQNEMEAEAERRLLER